MRESVFFRISCVLAFAALLAVVASLMAPGINQAVFSILTFYFPMLWALWLGCAIFVSGHKRDGYYLSLLWMLIDISILIYLISSWRAFPRVIESQGTDLVLYVMYCPVITPMVFLLWWVPDVVSNALSFFNIEFASSMKGGIGGVFKVWASLSFIAAVQSMLVVVVVRYIKVWRRRRGERNTSVTAG